MLIIGLTGPTGAGKSTVGQILADAGFHHIDGDQVSREVTAPGTPALLEIEAAFGATVINADGGLDRRKLGDIVFSDKDKLALLNSIIHKYITDSINKTISALEKTGCRGILIDGAALYESGISEMCDKIIAVTAPKDRRMRLITQRDNISENEAEKRISAQKSDSYYNERADFCIYNDSSVENLRAKARELVRKISEDI